MALLAADAALAHPCPCCRARPRPSSARRPGGAGRGSRAQQMPSPLQTSMMCLRMACSAKMPALPALPAHGPRAPTRAAGARRRRVLFCERQGTAVREACASRPRSLQAVQESIAQAEKDAPHSTRAASDSKHGSTRRVRLTAQHFAVHISSAAEVWRNNACTGHLSQCSKGSCFRHPPECNSHQGMGRVGGCGFLPRWCRHCSDSESVDLLCIAMELPERHTRPAWCNGISTQDR